MLDSSKKLILSRKEAQMGEVIKKQAYRKITVQDFLKAKKIILEEVIQNRYGTPEPQFSYTISTTFVKVEDADNMYEIHYAATYEGMTRCERCGKYHALNHECDCAGTYQRISGNDVSERVLRYERRLMNNEQNITIYLLM